MSEIIIDEFFNIMPSEHVSFHDDVLVHLQGKYTDMALYTGEGRDSQSFRALVNEIYVYESQCQRGVDRITYNKAMKYVVLQKFEILLSSLDLINKLIIKFFSFKDLEGMPPDVLIYQYYYCMAKAATCIFTLEKLFEESEFRLIEHELTQVIERTRRAFKGQNIDDFFERVWSHSIDGHKNSVSSQILNMDFSQIKTKRKNYV